jgi:hypothetical protein
VWRGSQLLCSPRLGDGGAERERHRERDEHRGVAAQVDPFESKGLKPGYEVCMHDLPGLSRIASADQMLPTLISLDRFKG